MRRPAEAQAGQGPKQCVQCDEKDQHAGVAPLQSRFSRPVSLHDSSSGPVWSRARFMKGQGRLEGRSNAWLIGTAALVRAVLVVEGDARRIHPHGARGGDRDIAHPAAGRAARPEHRMPARNSGWRRQGLGQARRVVLIHALQPRSQLRRCALRGRMRVLRLATEDADHGEELPWSGRAAAQGVDRHPVRLVHARRGCPGPSHAHRCFV